jgi:hypothetical protein
MNKRAAKVVIKHDSSQFKKLRLSPFLMKKGAIFTGFGPFLIKKGKKHPKNIPRVSRRISNGFLFLNTLDVLAGFCINAYQFALVYK